ncbi:putative WD repeat protein 61 [Paratrimastix pyriformis]|uniref:WD repeat protein 61 n=1 Tax=Paratrimastix pyriformis TaxID=342808 RepID=A0ABQ8UQR9_9EUKA|nr:putative WD repeat protein 61 [Paratrimastix pyriformis]
MAEATQPRSVIARIEKAHEESIWSIAWTRETNTVITGSLDETAKCWAVSDTGLTSKNVFDRHDLGVISVSAENSGNFFATSALDCTIRIFDLVKGAPVRAIDAGPVEAWTVSFSPDGNHVASGSQAGHVNVWDAHSGEKVQTFEPRGTNKFTTSVAYNNGSGDQIACGAMDGAVSVFDVATSKLLHKLEGHGMPVRALCFLPENRMLLTASDDMRINLWDVTQGQLVGTMTGHTSWVLALSASPEGRYFASGASDRRVKIWDLGSRQCVQTFDGHTDQVWGVAYSPDGGRLVSCGEDGCIQMYKV